METILTTNARRANLPFGWLIIQTLSRCGVEHFVVSPGSRLTPLVLAIAELGEERHSVCLDERSAAFQALGRIKVTRKPVAVVCTSGTAGAHYYPALIEARESGLPLVVLTADRPPELRQGHVGQTIDQLKLYGTYPVFQAELPLPEPDDLLMRQVREMCRRAVEAALEGGPVHLNCPFREPFLPLEGETLYTGPDGLLEGLEGYCPSARIPESVPDLPERTLILAGPRPWSDPESERLALLDLALRRGFPILADGTNPLRYDPREEAPIIVHYDRIVRDADHWAALAPEMVLLWGEPPTSKVLRRKLMESDLPGYQIGGGKPGMNPLHGRIQWTGSTVESFANRVAGEVGPFGKRWQEADRQFEMVLTQALGEPHPLFEGDVHRLLARILAPGTALLQANSLAVRDAEWFMPRLYDSLQPYSQRGANGIDGTVSLARGLAAGAQAPVFLVAGDLALLHDANGLMHAGQLPHGVFIVLINNQGGGIFEFLPISARTEVFERFFATPPAVDFRMLVEAHGGRHVMACTLEGLETAIREWDGSGITVAEVRVNRKASRDLHRKFLSIKP